MLAQLIEIETLEIALVDENGEEEGGEDQGGLKYIVRLDTKMPGNLPNYTAGVLRWNGWGLSYIPLVGYQEKGACIVLQLDLKQLGLPRRDIFLRVKMATPRW
jgi:hypothetical protein